MDSIEEAIAGIRSPLGPDIKAATERFRTIPEEFFEPALEAFTAYTFRALLPDLVQFEYRLQSIVQLAADAAPSERATAALSKIARCYLFGFDAETIAMCRAAVDVAVNDAINLHDGGAPAASMGSKLRSLVNAKLLSPDREGDAWDVWRHGNEVLHNNVEDIEPAQQLVRKSMAVVAELFPSDATTDRATGV
jgi:hypothetical protein